MRPVGSLAVFLAACGATDGYDVVVRVPGGAARALRVEVSVLGSCDDIVSPGDPPVATMRSVEVRGGEGERLGRIEPGRYGLYGRAWETGCALFAAGCDGFEVERGGSGKVQVTLEEIPARGCDPGEDCVGDLCEPGPDAGADAGPDGGPGDCGDVEPRIVATLPLPGEAWRVAVSDGVAYVAAGEAGLVVVDVADPDAPAILGSVGGGPGAEARGVAAEGGLAWIAELGGDFWVVDVGRPEAPEIVGRVDATWSGRDVAAGGGIAVVADCVRVPEERGSLRFVGVEDPASPAVRAEPGADCPYDVALVESWAVVADWEGGLAVWSFADPDVPARVAGVGGLVARSVAHRAPFAYVGLENGGLAVVDVGDPASPSPVGLLDGAGGENANVALAASGRHVLGAVEDAGLVFFDLSDPASPIEVARISEPPLSLNDVVVQGCHAFATDSVLGLHVVHLGRYGE